MGLFRVAKHGYNALTDSVEKMLVDSNHQTIVIGYSGSGSINVPATTVPGQVYAYAFQLGSSLGFVPYIWFYSTNLNQPGQPLSNYYQFSPVTQPGSGLQNLVPGDPWNFYYMPYFSGSSYVSYTADYMYYITYLPSQGSSSSASHPVSTAPFISVAKSSGNALTDSIQNLQWTTGSGVGVQTLMCTNQNPVTYTASMTLASGASNIFSYAHGLGYATPFNGMIENYVDNNYVNSASAFNFDTLSQFNSCQFAIDATNFYFYFVNNTANSITINFTIKVDYFIQP